MGHLQFVSCDVEVDGEWCGVLLLLLLCVCGGGGEDVCLRLWW